MAADLDRLKTTLLTSGLHQKDQPLYQVINQLIDALKAMQASLGQTSTSAGVSTTTLVNRTYLTELDETPNLPSSRRLLAGLGVSFDDTVAGERTVAMTASGIETLGYWAPLTDGDDLEMDLISNNGEAIMVWVPTP